MDFEVSGHQYRADKLDAKRQFHLARRLAPILSKLPGVQESKMFEAIADEIATMSDENCDYILDTCLSVVKRQQDGGAWVPVFNARANRTQFEDIDMVGMLGIARYVLEENLASFFLAKAAQSVLSQQATT